MNGEQVSLHSRSGLYRSPFFYHRVVLLICAIAISVPVFYKSRLSNETYTQAAFSVLSSSHGFVRISGDVRHAGIYPIGVNTMTKTAIKMAEPLSATLNGLSQVDADAYLVSGMALHVAVQPDGTLLLKKSQMNVNERLVMKVPLDINALSETDFDRVPGIGPLMAKRIVEYRHKNGGAMAVTDLLLIEGIGEKKYKYLLKYF